MHLTCRLYSKLNSNIKDNKCGKSTTQSMLIGPSSPIDESVGLSDYIAAKDFLLLMTVPYTLN